jgi:site-specific recombinase XerD
MTDLAPAGPTLGPDAASAVPLEVLLRQTGTHARRARTAATLRSYLTGWRHFHAWCDRRRLPALPASPSTVAEYLTDNADRLAVSTLRRRLTVIGQCHQVTGHTSPTSTDQVRRVWRNVRAQGEAPREVKPVVTATLRAMVAVLDDQLLGRRDRALLLFGFAGLLRRSELVALDVEDVTEVLQGLELVVRRSPGDEDGVAVVQPIPYGRNPATCPVRAWRAWVAAAGIASGPAFRAVDRHGNVSPGRLSDKTVARVVKRTAQRAGLDAAAFSSHSLRAGLAVMAAGVGASTSQLMTQGRWRSDTAVHRYERRGDLWRDVLAAQVGL